VSLQPKSSLSLLNMRFQNDTFYGVTVSPMPNPKHGRSGYPFSSGSSIIFDLSGMGHPTSSCATISTALRIIGAHTPHHYVKIVITLGGKGSMHIISYTARLY